MKNCQANALNQERKPRTNKREPHGVDRDDTRLALGQALDVVAELAEPAMACVEKHDEGKHRVRISRR